MVVFAVAFLMSACFGVIAQALPAALMRSGSSANAATTLGTLGSVSALVEVMLSNSFGKITDAIGRKPVLILAPALAVAARATVVVWPSLPVLLGARFCTTLVVPLFWLAFSSSLADLYGRSSTSLAIVNSRVAACMGLGYAVATLLGGKLSGVSLLGLSYVQLSYLTSCVLGSAVCLLLALGLRETLPPERRIPFSFSGSNPLLFMRLFRRGRLQASLNGVVLLQALSNGMGDLWQVMARELRGWGPSQCGQFASLAGLASMSGTLLTAPLLRLLGPRTLVLGSTAASASANLVLAHATTDRLAYGAIAPAMLGAGKAQPVSARIVNLATEAGVPQGALAAERSTLNAIVKVVAPSVFAWAFAYGSKRGVLALPFYLSSALLVLSALLAATVPADQWSSEPKGRAKLA